MRHLILAIALLGISSPIEAVAAGKPAASEDAGVDGRVMVADNVILPVVRDGRLVNYIFVSVRVELAPNGDLFRLKERAHFLRDALLRASHRTSLADPRADDRVDATAASRAFAAAAEEALGRGSVRGVSVEQTGTLRVSRS